MKRKYLQRDEIVYRLKQPGSPSVAVMSEETGVPTATLYAWLAYERRTHGTSPAPIGAAGMKKRVSSRTPSTKLRIVAGSIGLEGDALRAYCAEQGETVEMVLSWRDLALSGLEQADRKRFPHPGDTAAADIKALEAELRRKEAALAEAAALLVLKKKVQEIFGEEK